MKHWLIPLVVLCLLLTGCEGIAFIGFSSNPGGNIIVSGTVSIVQLQYLHDGTGNTIMFTAVTLTNPGSAVTVNFCGDQRTQFPMNQLVRVNYNTGIYCSTLVTVVIVAHS